MRDSFVYAIQTRFVLFYIYEQRRLDTMTCIQTHKIRVNHTHVLIIAVGGRRK